MNTTLSATDFDYIRDMVRNRAAISLQREQAYLAEARLDALARREGFTSLQGLIAQVRTDRQADDGLRRRVVEAMTTNESSFFRDLHPFEALRKAVLPELIAARAASRSLRIWCAACASGQEPYSVALLLREHLGPTLADWDITILATDLSSDILDKARDGRFTQLEVNRGVPAPLLVKYFRKAGAEWILSDELRRMVSFRHLNLIDPWPTTRPFDLILLRNVLIYFDAAIKRDLLDRAARALAADGYLFLGAAETTLNLSNAFDRFELGRAACYRPRPRR